MSLFAHPPELLAEACETRLVRDGDVEAYIGFAPDIAQAIANRTGDTMAWPIRTLDYVDALGRTLAFALHSPKIEGARLVELSIGSGGLPIRRHMIRDIGWIVFREAGMAHLIVRARPDDRRLIASLIRLGFSRRFSMGGRDVFAIAAADLPARWRRWRDRHVH